MRKVLVSLSLACFFLACKHQPDSVPEPEIANPGNIENDSVSFQTEILPLLAGNCAIPGCHDAASAQDDVVLNNYNNVMSTGDITPGNPMGSKLYEAITETDPDDRMPRPPAPPLSQAQIDLVAKWIREGARNTNIPRCDTMVYSYSGAVNGIIANNCRGCHSGTAPSGGVSLADYNMVKDAALNGKLICAIEHAAGCKPMPLNGPKMQDCKIRVIRKWKDAGCPDN